MSDERRPISNRKERCGINKWETEDQDERTKKKQNVCVEKMNCKEEYHKHNIRPTPGTFIRGVCECVSKSNCLRFCMCLCHIIVVHLYKILTFTI